MKPNTAVALLFGAGALMIRLSRAVSPRTLTAARAGAAGAAGIGALTLFEYAAGMDLGVDQLLFRDTARPPHTVAPGRMAPNTALALTLTGLAALTPRPRRRGAWAGQLAALAVVLLGMLRLYGFAFGVPDLGAPREYTGMALHTALALVLLGGAAFLIRPREGLAGLLVNSGTTGVLGRRMVATVVFVPPVLGRLTLAGQDAGWYGTRMGVALLVCGHVLVFLVLTFIALGTGQRAEVARDRAESQLRRHRWLQAFMDHTPAMIFVKDRRGRYLNVNSGFEQCTGKSREQVVGRRAEDVLPGPLARRVWADQRRVLADGVSRQREDILPVGGVEHSYLTTLFALPDDEGGPVAVCGVATDVTEKAAAQRETERARRLFSALLESAPEATVITDRHGIIVMVNDQAKHLFGNPRRPLIGSDLAQLAPVDRRRHQAALLRAYLHRLPRRPTSFDTDLWAVRGDGGAFPAEVSLSALQEEEQVLVVVTVRDITDRRRAEADRAARYEQQRRIAYTLQRSLMGEPPQLPHLPTARRYVASAQDAGVGGDWFDIIALDADHTGVVIGDVMGRGIDAAAVMGQLRAAAHALARTGTEPVDLITGLDAFVADLDNQLVTCCYLVIDHIAREITLCSAGHLPLLAATPGRPPHRIDAPVSVPLGIGGIPHHQTRIPLPAGATLALYTDGLIERPGTDLDTQIDHLADTLRIALKNGPTCLEQAADHILGTLIPDPAAHDDDVTLLLLHLPADDTAHLILDARPQSVAEGRRFVTSTLRDWGCPDQLIDICCLLASELLTNSVRHAQGPMTLTLSTTEATLTLHVSDQDATRPQPRDAAPDDESGRGLTLLSALADQWGTSPHPGGKTAWCTLRRTGPHPGHTRTHHDER
ncbi:SpoIIE family protein phosphatase [Streptomyces sp. Act143]|uniref:SpoIIE family protein phosphatase n=1 Tax=Streptomyces sp. Act143 TaxID=2200760 RepID=UPI0011B53100|nr:SpoIIE family protein phosphatase [Streptomyces sp. Act143]